MEKQNNPTSSNPAPASVANLMQTITSTPFDKIAELDFVKSRYITNYNACNPNADGELMYHRNLVFIKQALDTFKDKQTGAKLLIDPFSVYACITTMAVDGLSAAPSDGEVYMYPKEGKMFLQKQAGAHVRRLQQTGQILEVKKVNLVYKGDIYEVEDGMVKRHIEKFESDTIIAGYVKFLLPGGAEKHFTYRPSDWESWRSKSPIPFGDNWRHTPVGVEKDYKPFQPHPGFLKTKIISHAAQEKSWTPGRRPVTVEIYQNVYSAEDGEVPEGAFVATQVPVNDLPPITPHEVVNEAQAVPAPAASSQSKKNIVHDDDNF